MQRSNSIEDNIKKYKFEMLKNIIANSELNINLEEIKVTGDIWNILFRINAYDICNKLLELGTSYTAEEMAHQNEKDSTNGWYWIARWPRNMKMFRANLDRGILPLAKDLNIIHKNQTTTNFWYHLSSQQHQLGFSAFSVFIFLLKNDILPTSECLNISNEDFGTTNVWAELFKYKTIQRTKIINILLFKKNIFPSAQALSLLTGNNKLNIWHSIVENQYYDVMAKLFSLNIFPSAEDMRVVDPETNENVWFKAASHVGFATKFLELFKHNIWPNAMDVNKISKKNGVSIWHKFAENAEFKEVMEKLLDQKIYPTPYNANLIDKNFNSLWLLLSAKELTIFEKLLELNIFPTNDALSSVATTNTWFQLAYPKNIPIFEKLLDLNIWPKPSDLSCYTLNLKNTTWISLSVYNKSNFPIFNRLIEKNILPNSEDLSHFIDNGSTIWHNLGGNHEGQIFILKLFKKNIYPKIGDFEKICQKFSVWRLLHVTEIFKLLYMHGIIPQRETFIQNWIVEKLQKKYGFDDKTIFIKSDSKNARIFREKFNLTAENPISYLLSHSAYPDIYSFLFLYHIMQQKKEIKNSLTYNYVENIEELNSKKTNIEFELQNSTNQKEKKFLSQQKLAIEQLLEKTRKNLKLLEIKVNFPNLVWYLIAKNLFPPSLNIVIFVKLIQKETRVVIQKKYADDLNHQYKNKLWTCEEELSRVDSLLKHSSKSKNPTQIFRSHYGMTLFPKQTPNEDDKNRPEHLKPYAKTPINKHFLNVVHDPFLLRY